MVRNIYRSKTALSGDIHPKYKSLIINLRTSKLWTPKRLWKHSHTCTCDSHQKYVYVIYTVCWLQFNAALASGHLQMYRMYRNFLTRALKTLQCYSLHFVTILWIKYIEVWVIFTTLITSTYLQNIETWMLQHVANYLAYSLLTI